MIERTVYLHGDLATKFVEKITIYGDSVHRIIGVLGANFSGFKDHMINYNPGFHIRTGDIYRDTNSVQEPLGLAKEIHIIPAITGSGGKNGSAIFAIILGATLIFLTAGAAAPGVAGAAGTTGTSIMAGWGVGAGMVGFLAKVGVSLVLQGVSALLFTPDKPDQRDSPENTPNTYFNGAVNTIAQGNAVAIGYGTLLVGSAVISAGLDHETL